MVWLFLASFLAHADETFSVGEAGGTIVLPDGWSREIINANLGPDQFQSDDGLKVITLREQNGLWLHEDDFKAWVATADSVLRDNPKMIAAKGTVVSTTKHGNYGRKVYSGTYSNVDVNFEVGSYGERALGYTLISWSGASSFGDLKSLLDELPKRITLPDAPPKTASRRVSIDGFDISVDYASDLFRVLPKEESGDAVLALQSIDSAVEVYMLTYETHLSVEQAIEGSAKKVESRFERQTQTGQKSVRISGKKGLAQRSQGITASLPASAWTALVPLADGLHLDLRMSSSSSLEGREEMWQELIKSIRIQEREPLDAFPPPRKTATQSERSKDAANALKGAIDLGRIPATPSTLFISETGVHGLLTGNGATLLDLESGESTAHPLQVDYVSAIVGSRGDSAFVHNTGQVTIVGEGSASEGWAAEAVVDLGDSWLVLRGDAPINPIGFSDSVVLNKVWSIRDGKTETPLPDVFLPKPYAGSGTPNAPLALMAVGSRYSSPVTLYQVDLKAGTSNKMTPWHDVRYIAPDPSGWLVTGAPQPGAMGVYRVDKTGAHRRIMAGNHYAARFMQDGSIVLITRAVTENGPPWNEWPVYRIPAKIIPDLDQALSTSSLAALESYAATVPAEHLGDSVWSDKAALSRAIAAARAAWTDALGPVPTSPEQADDLLHTLSGFPVLDPRLWRTSELLMVGALIDAGAEWVESDRAPVPTMERSVTMNDHAIGFAPLVEIRLSLQESEAWYAPITSMLESANGRTLVLGKDLRRVQERVHALDGEPLPLQATAATQILSWVQDHPQNAYGRQRLILVLAANGWMDALATLTRDHVDLPDRATSPQDVVGWWASQASAKPQVRIKGLRAAIAYFPRQAGLYLLLGQAYEDSAEPDRIELARACYSHVTATLSWSQGTQAQAALDRLPPESAEDPTE